MRPVRASVLLALFLSASVVSPPAFADTPRPERRALRVSEAEAPITLDAAAEAARLEAIAKLKDIMTLRDIPRATRAEMFFRLAELYWEQGRAVQMRESQACFESGADCNNLTEGRKWQEKSLTLYRRLATEYPEYGRADEVAWFHGRTLLELGRPEEAGAELTRLVKTWPDSRYVTDAYVLIGEEWFDGGEVIKAMAAYKRAAADKSHEKASFARYKLAWCLFNVGEPDEALAELRTVLAAESGIKLREEAIADYVRFFAETGETDLAGHLGRYVGAAELLKQRNALASHWLEQGKMDPAVVAWRQLGADAPNDPQAPSWADGIVRAHLRAGKIDAALTEVERMDERFAPGGAWAGANAARADAFTEARDTIATRLRTIATQAHSGSRHGVNQLPVAERAYARYLASFPTGAHAYDMRYGYAELLYRVKRFDEAHDQYVAVVEMDPAGKHSRFCAESAIFAAAEMVKRAPPAPVAGAAPVPLSEWEVKQIAAIDRYLEGFGGEKSTAMTYQAGYIHYRHNQFREASERFRAVIAANPGSKQSEQAAHLILDGLALVEDWEALADTAKLCAESRELGSEPFRREARGIYESASFKRIEARYARDEDKAVAADAWVAYADAFPTSPHADLALHDAAVVRGELGDLRGAIAAREALVARFPRSKHRVDALAALGFGYESLARFDRAADWYEALAAAAPGHPDAPAALYSAGLFRSSTGAWQAAVSDWQRYVTAYPDRADVPAITLELGQLLASRGRTAEASALFQRFFDDPPAGASVDEVLFARLRFGELLDPTGAVGPRVARHWEESLAWWRNAESAGLPSDLARGYAAQMRYLLAEPQYRAFMAMRIAGPEGRALSARQTDALLESQLSAKVRAMRTLEATYAGVVGTGAGVWGLAALARLGGAYENLGATLESSYIPDYLTEEQRWMYTERLRDLAFTQNERAASTYRTALGRAYELNVYDARTADVVRRLGELRPDEGWGLAERVPKATFTAPAVFVGALEE